jgi:hypothetical protein
MKSKFIKVPRMTVTQLPGTKFRRAVELQGDLVYKSAEYGGKIIVAKGFISDGASVPQVFWNRYPPFGQYLEAAVVHDYFCELGHAGQSPIDYKAAARIFREAMIVKGVGKWKRNVMYQAVLWFGPKFKAKA